MSKLQIKLECFESLESTNTYLRQQAAKGAPEGTVVIANAQTAGRGRMGRSFSSAPGLGIYMSLLLRPDCAPEKAHTLTASTAAAVCRAIEKASGLEPEIKWVNDIILRGRKICGVLCESSASEKGLDYVVVGIGLNVINREEDFPPELRSIAGSIYSQSGLVIERGALIAAILSELDAMYSAWQENGGAYLNEYKKRCKMLGRLVEITGADGNELAVAEDIMSDFGLKVRLDSGETRVLRSGEVSVKPSYKE